MSRNDIHKQLVHLLKELRLPMFREYFAELSQKAVQQDLTTVFTGIDPERIRGSSSQQDRKAYQILKAALGKDF